MRKWESGSEHLTEQVALNTYVRKWLRMPNCESGFEGLSKKMALNA